MRSKILLAGLVGSGVLTVVAVIAAAQAWWWLVTACAMALLTALFVVALDANRRVRYLRRQVRAEAAKLQQDLSTSRPEPADATPAPFTDFDVTGAVQVLQAQYIGRIDRMQQSLDRAVVAVEQASRTNHTPDRDTEHPAG